jgi:hypothetical protein
VNPESVTLWLALIGIATAVVSAIFGIVEYRNSNRLRRAEWLYKLYQQFYVEENLKSIREELDSIAGRKRLESIISKKENELNQDEERKLSLLCDYLNFFEVMFSLQKNTALIEQDIIDLFDYYLSSILKSKAVFDYAGLMGFDLLHDFLENRDVPVQDK